MNIIFLKCQSSTNSQITKTNSCPFIQHYQTNNGIEHPYRLYFLNCQHKANELRATLTSLF